MKIFKQIAHLKAFLWEIKKDGKSIGLVPTMGALHKGHISLINVSKSNNPVTVATIYINPTQFNNPEDLLKYPRTLDKDLEMLEKAGCDVVFSPDDQEMYQAASMLKMDFGHLDKVMEGKFRPGHFSGVALVVAKLFNVVEPDHAYFGQKDWQQVAVIGQLVRELKFNLVVHSVPIVREQDGLAMSSRNLRLNAEQRNQASVFFRALTLAKTSLNNGVELQAVKKAVTDLVNSTPGMQLEYFELSDSENLSPLDRVDMALKPILCIAGYAGEIRLIDNMFLD